MSKTLAIVLSIIGGLLLMGIIAVGGVVYWVYQARENLSRKAENMKEKYESRRAAEELELKKENEKVRAKYEELQRKLNDRAKTNNEGCLQEALSRYKRDKSFTGRTSTQGFLTVCLQASEPSPEFCDGVPPQNEIMKSANWTLKKCSDAGLQNDQGCQQIFGAVQAYCHRSK